MPRARTLRADAARNRAKILEAANDLIVEHGPDVPMESIAAAAGVAVGTLYRHYPTKRALVGAVIESHFTHMADEAEAAEARIAAGERATDALRSLAYRIMDGAAHNQAVKAAARSMGADDALHHGSELQRGIDVLARIIAAAKADGGLRADLTVEDLLLFFKTVPVDAAPAVRARWCELMLDGFSAGRP
ncbi:TetR/AcrR family transcriptional regulator [Glycomyces xiaoerkulensis]|uniref:TetR/AcrR family transcriptional regulator n=1 Tax=Glycomyces xiaoerkulensis TaxID=2038139 RepID=UPI000C266EBD|nr:TetR family transcriptional regulator [Glycomyces xiaoerkulensis]